MGEVYTGVIRKNSGEERRMLTVFSFQPAAYFLRAFFLSLRSKKAIPNKKGYKQAVHFLPMERRVHLPTTFRAPDFQVSGHATRPSFFSPEEKKIQFSNLLL